MPSGPGRAPVRALPCSAPLGCPWIGIPNWRQCSGRSRCSGSPTPAPSGRARVLRHIPRVPTPGRGPRWEDQVAFPFFSLS